MMIAAADQRPLRQPCKADADAAAGSRRSLVQNGTHAPLSATRYRYRNEDNGYEGHIEVDELGLPLSYEGVWSRTADWSPA
jgi:hypothetical protein